MELFIDEAEGLDRRPREVKVILVCGMGTIGILGRSRVSGAWLDESTGGLRGPFVLPGRSEVTLELEISEEEKRTLSEMFQFHEEITLSRHPQYDQIPRSAPRSAVKMRAELPFWAVQPKGDRTGKGERKRKGKNRWR